MFEKFIESLKWKVYKALYGNNYLISHETADEIDTELQRVNNLVVIKNEVIASLESDIKHLRNLLSLSGTKDNKTSSGKENTIAKKCNHCTKCICTCHLSYTFIGDSTGTNDVEYHWGGI